MKNWLARWKDWAEDLELELSALLLAYRDPRTPWYAKALTALVIAYAFSPIDLIPDFIPILGYLDDLILLPVGIFLVLRLVPAEVMRESRERASTLAGEGKPVIKSGALIIAALWLLVLLIIIYILWRAWLARSGAAS